MIAKRSKVKTPFPRAKIARAIKTLLPKGNFELRVSDSLLDGQKIVRVVTPAWKSLWAGDRILKVMDAVDGVLTREEQKRILRYSVLTPEEYDEVARRPRAWFRPAKNLVAKKMRVRKTV